MNRGWISVAWIVLLVTQLFCARPTATPPPDLSIGQIEKIKGGVQGGARDRSGKCGTQLARL